jgi:hypothetical protein
VQFGGVLKLQAHSLWNHTNSLVLSPSYYEYCLPTTTYPLAIHHYIAFFIFFAIGFDPNSISLVTLIPILIHIVFWILGATSLALLSFYNWCLVLAGMILIHNNLSVGVKAQPIGNMLPAGAISLTWVNYYIYCLYYNGSACIRNDWFGTKARGFVFWSLFNCILSFSLVYIIAIGYSRRTWISQQVVPTFARKDGFLLYMDASTSTVTLKKHEPHWIKVLRSIPASSPSLPLLVRGYFYALWSLTVFLVMDFMLGETSFVYKWVHPYLGVGAGDAGLNWYASVSGFDEETGSPKDSPKVARARSASSASASTSVAVPTSVVAMTSVTTSTQAVDGAESGRHRE